MSKKNKKILIINTTYRQLGGEDINIIEEVNFLQKFYKVDYLEFQNKKKLQFKDLYVFFETPFKRLKETWVYLRY